MKAPFISGDFFLNFCTRTDGCTEKQKYKMVRMLEHSIKYQMTQCIRFELVNKENNTNISK